MLNPGSRDPNDASTRFWRRFTTNRTRDYFTTTPLEDIKGRTVRGSGISMLAQGVKLATGLVTLAIMARLLTPADYGIFALLFIVVNLALVFGDLGLSAATIQRKALTHTQASALFWVNVGAGIALALILSLSAPAVAWLFDEPKLTLALPVIATTFLFGGIAAQHGALLSRSMHFASVSTADTASQIVGSAIGVAAALAGAGYWSLIFMQVGIGISQMFLVMSLSRWSPGRPRRPFFPTELVRFGGNITGFNLLNYFARNGDNILIGAVYGSAQLGFYSRAYSLLLQPLTQIMAPLARVVVPALSRIGSDERLQYRRAFLSIVGKLSLVTAPLMAFAIVNAHSLVRVLLGDQWNESARIFAILGFAGIAQPIGFATGWLFVTQGRTGEMLRWSMITFPVTIGVFLIGLPFGPVGVASAYTIYYVSTLPVLLWFVCRSGPVTARDIYRVSVPAVVVSAAVGIATLGVRVATPATDAPVELVVSGLIAIAAAAASLALLPSGRRQIRETHGAVAASLRRRA